MELRDCLKTNLQPGYKIAVLGIGSTLRSDDAAGIYFVELLGKRIKKDNLLLIAGSTAPENFTGVIKDFAPDKLFIVDAAYVGGLPGEVKVIPAAEISGVSFSTHMLPLPVMLKYLAAELPCDVIFIGIQPKSTEHGFVMSEEVKRETERLAEDFAAFLAAAE
ncbi:MAG: hydrogenase maturation peptidase HycI [Firmicutes bacterium]|jgi:hydrogenase 3 maturation protease|nr:hydrogenase maturation peptidase HycI [Bacillota bacterium]